MLIYVEACGLLGSRSATPSACLQVDGSESANTYERLVISTEEHEWRIRFTDWYPTFEFLFHFSWWFKFCCQILRQMLSSPNTKGVTAPLARSAALDIYARVACSTKNHCIDYIQNPKYVCCLSHSYHSYFHGLFHS